MLISNEFSIVTCLWGCNNRRIDCFKEWFAQFFDSGNAESLLDGFLERSELNVSNSYFILIIDRHGIQMIKGPCQDFVFQKERLWNLAACSINTEYIFFTDADAIYHNTFNIFLRCKEALRNHDFVHPFSIAQCQYDEQSIFKWSILADLGGKFGGTPGLCLAARTEKIQKLRFFEYCIVGGGDSCFMSALLKNTQYGKKIESRIRNLMNPNLFDAYEAWASHFKGCTFKYLPNSRISALSHGSLKSRRYVSRWELLRNFNLNTYVNGWLYDHDLAIRMATWKDLENSDGQCR